MNSRASPKSTVKKKGSKQAIPVLSDLDHAIKLVQRDYCAGVHEPIQIQGKVPFGKIYPLTTAEGAQLESLRSLIERYVLQRLTPRPLCLAVFGPPGSGKSFAVKQIRSVVVKNLQFGESKISLPLTVVNLTQVSEAGQVGRVVARIAGEQDPDTVPIVFFDEFDAPRNGAPYGWLGWFLSPMHDGEFLHEGAPIKLKRAIYVFAGGTASTMREFSQLSSTHAFRSAKGPDFISRLRGFLDVQGPNEHPRMLRRALLIRSELEGQADRNGKGHFSPDEQLLRSMLTVGRYRHGARSIAAVVELSTITADQATFSWLDLPEDHLLGLHVDRGPLDTKLIGGSVAFSGYQSNFAMPGEGRDGVPLNTPDHTLASCWLEVAKACWSLGATVAYAGNWRQDISGQLMQYLVAELERLPVELSRSEAKRGSPAPWLESFQRLEPRKPRGTTNKSPNLNSSGQDDMRLGLRVISRDFLTNEERLELNKWQRTVLGRFRQRLAAAESSVARFAVGGAVTQHGGRIPGIAEELMIALALRQPVYVVGGFGGACAQLGSLLGLGHPRTGAVPPCLKALSDQERQDLSDIAEKLRPSPWIDLPVHESEVALFFRRNSLQSPGWPENGLTIQENRQLFESSNPDEVVRLIVRGLLQRFDSRVSP